MGGVTKQIRMESLVRGLGGQESHDKISRVTQQIKQHQATLSESKSPEETNQIPFDEIYAFSRACTAADLQEYFKTLIASLKQEKLDGNLVLALNVAGKKLYLIYGANNTLWMQNDLDSKEDNTYSVNLNQKEASKDLAAFVMENLSETTKRKMNPVDTLVIATKAYSHGAKPRFVEHWQQSYERRALTDLSYASVMKRDVKNISWFQMAIAHNDTTALTAMLNNPDIRSRLFGGTEVRSGNIELVRGFVVAFFLNQTAVMKLLLEAGVSLEEVMLELVERRFPTLTEKNAWLELLRTATEGIIATSPKLKSLYDPEIARVRAHSLLWRESINNALRPFNLNVESIADQPKEVVALLIDNENVIPAGAHDIYQLVDALKKFPEAFALLLKKAFSEPLTALHYIRSPSELHYLLQQCPQCADAVLDFLMKDPARFRKFIPNFSTLQRLNQVLSYPQKNHLNTWSITNPNDSHLKLKPLSSFSYVSQLITEMRKNDMAARLYIDSLLENTEEFKRLLPNKDNIDEINREYPEFSADITAKSSRKTPVKSGLLSAISVNMKMARHGTILDFMEYMGYPDMSKGGCYGISLSKMMAMLIGKVVTTDARGRVKFERQVDHFNQRLIRMADIYEKHVEKYKSERDKHYKYDTAEKWEAFLKHRRESILKDVEAEVATLPETIQKERVADVTEIFALFDSVALIQRGAKYSELYTDKFVGDQNFAQTLNLCSSQELDKKGGIVEVDHAVGIYDLEKFTHYFKSCRTSFLEQGVTHTVGLNLLNMGHSITIGFDPLNKVWILGDPNALFHLELPFESDGEVNDHMLALVVMTYLVYKDAESIEPTDKVMCYSHYYMTAQDLEAELKVKQVEEKESKLDPKESFITNWLNTPEMKAMHQFTIKNCLDTDSEGHQVFFHAMQDLRVAKAVAADPAFLAHIKQNQAPSNMSILDMCFTVALNNQKSEIKLFCLEQGVDIEKIARHLSQGTAASYSVRNNQFEVLIALCEDYLRAHREDPVVTQQKLSSIKEQKQKWEESLVPVLSRLSLTLTEFKALSPDLQEYLFIPKLAKLDPALEFSDMKWFLVKFPQVGKQIIDRVLLDTTEKDFCIKKSTEVYQLVRVFPQHEVQVLTSLLANVDKFQRIFPTYESIKKLSLIDTPTMNDFLRTVFSDTPKYKLALPQFSTFDNLQAFIDEMKKFPYFTNWYMPSLFKNEKELIRLVPDKVSLQRLCEALPEHAEELRKHHVTPPLFKAPVPSQRFFIPRAPDKDMMAVKKRITTILGESKLELLPQQSDAATLRDIIAFSRNANSRDISERKETKSIKDLSVTYANQAVTDFYYDRISYNQMRDILQGLHRKLIALPHLGLISRMRQKPTKASMLIKKLEEDLSHAHSAVLDSLISSVRESYYNFKLYARVSIPGVSIRLADDLMRDMYSSAASGPQAFENKLIELKKILEQVPADPVIDSQKKQIFLNVEALQQFIKQSGAQVFEEKIGLTR